MTDKLARPHLRKLTEHNRPASGTPAGGNGWGSPPNAPKAFSADYQPRPGHIQAGKDARAALVEYLLTKHKAAADVILRVMEDREAPHAAQVSAAVHVLDRTLGKPHQSVDTTVKHSGNIGNTPEALLLDMLTTEELEIMHQLRLSAEERATEGQEP